MSLNLRWPLVALLVGLACATAPVAPTVAAPADPRVAALTAPGPTRGAANPRVTIVEFGDYQCPFCRRAEKTLEALRLAHPDLAVVWREHPLPFHRNAEPAAEAAQAAGAQGKYWEMHDLLFAHQSELSGDNYLAWARQLGLDVARFQADLASHRFQARLAADAHDAQAVEATGTPTFFVDGRLVSGAQPQETFEEVIKSEEARVALLLQGGLPAETLYPTEVALNALAPAPAAKPSSPSPNVAKPGAEAVEVALGGGYLRGPKDAKVTIVELSDFQCPFCGRVQPTLTRLLAAHPGEVRLVWRDHPLPFHANAERAAIAARAAGRQGKFWEMHDRLFANQQSLKSSQYDLWAAELGLDPAQFARDLADDQLRQAVKDDAAYAASLGATGTPTFFVDGRRVLGAQPYDAFEAIVADELAKADRLLREGTPRADLYGALVAANVRQYRREPAAPVVDDAAMRHEIALGDAPLLGSPNARVTLVEFGDFQCPYTARAEATLRQIREVYGDKVRIVWKNQPLPFHVNALPAAKAALAAQRQGQFWAMHDRLLRGQGELGDESYRRWAGELGLDVVRFDQDRAAEALGSAIERDKAQGAALGANGTPTFFIDGLELVGAQPFEKFQAIIDDELRGSPTVARSAESAGVASRKSDDAEIPSR